MSGNEGKGNSVDLRDAIRILRWFVCGCLNVLTPLDSITSHWNALKVSKRSVHFCWAFHFEKVSGTIFIMRSSIEPLGIEGSWTSLLETFSKWNVIFVREFLDWRCNSWGAV